MLTACDQKPTLPVSHQQNNPNTDSFSHVEKSDSAKGIMKIFVLLSKKRCSTAGNRCQIIFLNFFAGFINVVTWHTHTHTRRPNETKLNVWFEIYTRTLLPKRRCYRNSTTIECSFAPRMEGNGQVHVAPSEWVCHKQMETRSKWTHQNQTQGRSQTEWSRKCKSWLNSASDRWQRSKHGQNQNPWEGRKSCTQNW